jgi:hypothetical protein
LKKTSNATGFLFLNFNLENLIVLSRFIQKSIKFSFFFGRWVAWAQTAIISVKLGSKNAEDSTIVLWKTGVSRIFEEF